MPNDTIARKSAGQSPPLPPPQLRTWLSLVLFIHLFAVVVAVTSYASPSGLQTRLVSTLALYLKPLNFSLTHRYRSTPRYYLTHATNGEIEEQQVRDIDYRIEIGPKLSDEAATVFSVPPGGIFPLVRWNRYQALANAAGDLASNERSGFEDVLIKPLGAAALAELGVKKVAIRCRGHLLPTMEDLESSDPDRNNPLADAFYGAPYDFQVLVVRGDVSVMKSSAAGEVAPVEKGK